AFGGESVFNGVAQQLISHRIPAVVAMQYSVRVDAAIQFAEQFYRSLGCKNSLATAISQAQEAMGGGEGNQWYRPVLYLRWQDNEGGQLFTASPVQSDKVSQDSTQLSNKQPQKRPLSRFQQRELERLTTELDDLEQDYDKIKSQLRTELDGATQNKLERQLEQIGQDMAQREQQLDRLKQGNG
ncbi:CHAT domain-containing protein, partial [Coleofasciculus sp. LEGE 07081]